MKRPRGRPRRNAATKKPEPRGKAEDAAVPARSRQKAMIDFCSLVGRGIPEDILAAATAADFDAARAELEQITKAQPKAGTFWGGEAWESRRQWERCKDRAQEFGVPYLQGAIARRRKAEAEAAWQRRIDAGFDVELEVLGATIDKMMGLFPVDGDREDPRVVGAAVLSMPRLEPSLLRQPPMPLATNAPPYPREPAPLERTVSSTSAADFRAALEKLEREEAAAAAAKAERRARGVTISLHLAGDAARHWLPFASAPMTDAAATEALVDTLGQAIRSALEPPVTPRHVDREAAYAPSYVFAQRHGLHGHNSPGRTKDDYPGPDYLP